MQMRMIRNCVKYVCYYVTDEQLQAFKEILDFPRPTRLVHMWEWLIRNIVAQKRTQLVPAVAFRQLKDQQVVAAPRESLQVLFVVPLVSRDVGALISRGATCIRTVDPVPHRRFRTGEVFNLTANPCFGGSAGQNKLASRKFVVELFVEYRPGVVFERVEFVDHGKGHFVDLGDDIRIFGAEGAHDPIAKLPEREFEARGAGFMESDTENFGFHGVFPIAA